METINKIDEENFEITTTQPIKLSFVRQQLSEIEAQIVLEKAAVDKKYQQVLAHFNSLIDKLK